MGRPRTRKNPNDLPYAEIGRRLKQLREALGDKYKNQTAFAKAIGVAPSTYSPWENGKRRPEIENALVMKEKFHVTLDYIYAGDTGGLSIKLEQAINAVKSAS